MKPRLRAAVAAAAAAASLAALTVTAVPAHADPPDYEISIDLKIPVLVFQNGLPSSIKCESHLYFPRSNNAAPPWVYTVATAGCDASIDYIYAKVELYRLGVYAGQDFDYGYDTGYAEAEFGMLCVPGTYQAKGYFDYHFPAGYEPQTIHHELTSPELLVTCVPPV